MKEFQSFLWFLIFTGYACVTVVGEDCQCTSTGRYSVCNCLVSWSEADRICTSQQSQLVTIRSEEENEELSGELHKVGLVQAWIGGKVHTEDWRWTTSETPLQGQGCFQFTGDVAQFDYSESGNDITPLHCMDTLCREQGLVYAAVMRGDTCLCMRSRPDHDLGRGCDLSCSGDANTRCGGTEAYYLYHTQGTYSEPWGRGLPDSSSQQPQGRCLVLQCRYTPVGTWSWVADQCTVSQPIKALCQTDLQRPCAGSQYGDHCYTEPWQMFFSWYEASYHCYQMGGYLAEITSREMFQKITGDVVKCFRSKYWIGGSVSVVKWTTGTLDEPVHYTNWNGDFPTAKSGETCLFVSNYVFGSESTLHKWGDQNCDYMSAFVCQQGEDVTTEIPSTPQITTRSTPTLNPPVTKVFTQPRTSTTQSTTTTGTTTTQEQVTSERKTTPPAAKLSTTMQKPTTQTPVTSSTQIMMTTTITHTLPNITTDHGSTKSEIFDGLTTKSTLPKDINDSTPFHTDKEPVLTGSTAGSILTEPWSTVSSTDHGLGLEGTGTTHKENTSVVAAAVETDPKDGISGAEVGGAILIAVAVLIVLILCVLAVYYIVKAYQKYLAGRREQGSRSSPRGPFVRDGDFSYMDVSRTSSTESKSKKPSTYDKERSLRRYNSLDIDKELKKEQNVLAGNENLNNLNNQPQTGNALDKEDDSKPLPIPNKNWFDYIDNVGANPKDNNLQIEKEILQQTPQAEPDSPAEPKVIPSTLPKQKTVIQITSDKDIIDETESHDAPRQHIDEVEPSQNVHISDNESNLSDTSGNNIDPILGDMDANGIEDDNIMINTEGYINDDFEDADYAHPREYEISYA